VQKRGSRGSRGTSGGKSGVERRQRRLPPGRVLWPLVALGCNAAERPAEYAVWSAAPQDYSEIAPLPGSPTPVPETLEAQTLRQIVHVSAGGDALRVQLSNLFGHAPLGVDAVSVAPSNGGSTIDSEHAAQLTFHGSPSITIPAGAVAMSDFAPLAVPSESDVAVSMFIGGSAAVSTVHRLAEQTMYLASGNAVSAAELPGVATRQSYYWLTEVDAEGPMAPLVIVAFGDSITDGMASTPDTDQRYPNVLSKRLLAEGPHGPYSVVNAGISGNRLLRDGIGPSGLSRFGRDALGPTGVTDIVLLLGINDIGFSAALPEQAASTDDIITGLGTLLASTEGTGVSILLGTLLPFKGAAPPYYDTAGEAKRQALNDWIRNTSGARVIDFDQALRDDTDPSILNPAFDSGDHLHPNDAGYAAMAAAIDLTAFE
jgi:lysophospholipase L1-like esterase